jgi:uncharacterized protein (TIGR03118 family)
MADIFTQTNLVSDVPGDARNTDPNLINPWGVSFSATSPFWISNQGSGTSTLYDGVGNKVPLTVPIPGGNPTGQVFAGGSGFSLPSGGGAFFIFDTLNGTIDAWGGTNPAVQVASTPGAVYTGLSLASSGASNYLYAADATGQIRVFNSSYQQIALTGNFTDPNAISGYKPFNIQLIGSDLYVTYAEIGPMGTAVPGSTGYVDKFNTNGVFLNRVVSGGALDAPWGVVQAPAGFGNFGNDLLVGNFGNGEINAYTLNSNGTGTFAGTIDGANGQPLVNDFLWALEFRTGGANTDPSTLYFTAGINNQQDGLFGEIATPEPAMAIPVFLGIAGLAWMKLRRRSLR